MCEEGLIDEAERMILNECDSSIREIRNKLVHKDLYQYGIELDGISVIEISLSPSSGI
jgi:hypothetical protein